MEAKRASGARKSPFGKRAAIPFSGGAAVMLRELAIFLYAITAGFTASGITANLYRLLAKGRTEDSTRTAYYASMVLAGPNVLFQKAAEARRTKDCSLLTFWMAAAICGYWSFAIGLFLIEVALAL